MLKTCIVVLSVLAAAPAAAQEKFDATARAKAVAPFVDPQAVAVLRVDLTRLALEPLLAKIGELVPEMREDLAEARLKGGPVLAAFTQAGAKDVYYVFTLGGGWGIPVPVGLVPLPGGADEKRLLAALPDSERDAQRIGDALVFPSGPGEIERIRRIQPEPRPELAAAFEAAGDTAAQLILIPPAYSRRVIEETMPELPEVIGGGPSTILTRGLSWAAVGIDLPPNMVVHVVVKSPDAQAASALRAKWIEVLRFLPKHVEVRKWVTDVDRFTATMTPTLEGDRLLLRFDPANRGIERLLELAVPALDQARAHARRSQSANNLKLLMLAMHNFHDVYKSSPAVGTFGQDGRPLLSWRVHILPYLDQEKLYKEFRLNEPWDSPHNRALIDKMPPLYRSPASRLREKGKTNYVLPVGPGTCFPGREGITFQEIKDGTSNTIAIVEADDAQAVIWTKPGDLPFDPKRPLAGLGGLYKEGFCAAYWDGSVHFIPIGIAPETLRRLIDPNDGQPIPIPPF
jgi:hypothetical protein